LKKPARRKRIPEEDRNEKPKYGYPRPNRKITDTHKKQENNLVKRIRVWIILGRGLSAMHRFSDRGDIDSWLIQGKAIKFRVRIVNSEIPHRSEEVRENKVGKENIYTNLSWDHQGQRPKSQNKALGLQESIDFCALSKTQGKEATRRINKQDCQQEAINVEYRCDDGRRDLHLGFHRYVNRPWSLFCTTCGSVFLFVRKLEVRECQCEMRKHAMCH
jgi:hypothetical protein